ncbi:MAG: tetratricopeptide repeat protein [Bacillota bacterium]|nr:tetratricopeptide repeat protein [Bacillota bacterium]
MFERISKYLSEKTKDVVFTELKEGKEIVINNYKIDNSFSIPMMTKDIIKKVKGEEDFDINIDSIVNGMIKVIGIDLDFKHTNEYITFLLNFDSEIGKKILKNGLYYASKELYIEALIHMRAAYKFLNDDINVIYNYAKLCDQLAEKEKDNVDKSNNFLLEAKEVFNYIVEKYPEFPDSYYFLGFYYAMDNKYNKAREYFKIALNNGIDDDKKGKIVELIKDFEDKSQFEIGSELVMNERFQEGLEKLLPLEEFHNDWWNLLFFIGLAYRHLSEYNKAIDYFTRTLKYNSGHSETLNELGISCLSIGNTKGAKKAYSEAIKMNPNNHELLCNMGIVHLNEQNFDEAERYFGLAKKIKGDDEIVNAWIEKLNESKK